MPKNRLIILAALEMESRAACRALGVRFQRNRVLAHASAPIEIHTIGMGAKRLPQVMRLLRPTTDDRIWMVGLAGALDPTLRVGDVVIDCDEPTPVIHLTDGAVRQGRIHTANGLVSSPAEKRALFAATAALAVDMEQHIVRKTFAPLGISVFGLRAISDTADTRLDPALPGLVDSVGRPKWAALATALLRRPALFVSLITLGRDSSHAGAKLTQALMTLSPSCSTSDTPK